MEPSGHWGRGSFATVGRRHEAIVDNRLRLLANSIKQRRLASDWCRHLANTTKHNVGLDFGPLAPLCENMTSSIKPEVHNILQCRPRPQVTRKENFMKFGLWFLSSASGQTDKQTDTQTRRWQYLTRLPGAN